MHRLEVHMVTSQAVCFFVISISVRFYRSLIIISLTLMHVRLIIGAL